ncbi:Aspartyl aminopeptidase [Labilithrix luteola]|uniref:M18 family aminopeptidase n=1 Tax=Labilithrix luteola TaxID=1391654 RepID=A0A0K1Q0Y4_9BACT|nr:M18 family aminopeptidase [Labilithrix luteola]AKU99397.1 Aspartyl aminopeptidase [Labilithrix luteola]
MADPVFTDLLSFLGDSPTPFHAVVSATARLRAKGFTPIAETDSWADLAPGRYVFAHGGSSLLAFVIPEGKRISGFRIVGAHTDSPNLRLKPQPEYKKEGYAQLGVEVYGGVLLNSWLDRDLSLAGRVFLKQDAGAPFETRLVRFRDPMLRVTQLAIHLDRDVNDKGLVLNKQEHLAPIFGLASDGGRDLSTMLAEEMGVPRERIAGSDLMLYDVVAPTQGGRDGEFLFSGRLDNLAMSHAAIAGILAAVDKPMADDLVPVAALFDHEEVGSETAYGANSTFLPRALERIVLGRGGSREDYHRALAGSLCVSADMAHAVHPNYESRHEARHKPVLNGGPVIKVNAQQRYATSGSTAALFRDLCARAEVPVQHYAHRTDLPCGSTIGPIASTLLGIRTVDVGNPMLSMHSIRELGGSRDPGMMTRVLELFYGCPDPGGS